MPTLGLQNITNDMVAGKIPSRSRLVATRYYYGDGTVCRGDSVVMTRFGGGYFDGAGKPYYELADYQGNITTVIDSDGAIVSHTGFYPYGQPWRRPGELQWLYGGKEWLGADGRDEYDFHARRQYPHLGIFSTPDPLAESTHWISTYAYCGGNPIRYTDPTGLLFTPRSWIFITPLLQEAESKKADELKTAVTLLATSGDINEAFNHLEKAGEYCDIISEIDELDKSDTMYDVAFKYPLVESDKYTGTTTFNESTHCIEIRLPDLSLDLIAHELKHAYQFETGRIHFGKMQADGTPLYDQTDEIEAYKRSELFGGPTWEDVNSAYSHLRPNPYESLKSTPIKESILQKWSDDYTAIFKANGKIYVPSKK